MKENDNCSNTAGKTEETERTRTLTHQAISDYLWCPRKYYLGSIRGMEPEFVLPIVLLETSVYRAIAVYNEHRAAGGTAPLRVLLRTFDEAWDADAARVRLTLPVTMEGLRERGHDMLRAFHRNPMHAGKVIGAGLDFKFGFCPHMPPVSGTIDVVECDARGRIVLTQYMAVQTLGDRPIDRLVIWRTGAQSLGLIQPQPVLLRQCQITTTENPVVSVREFLPPDNQLLDTWFRLVTTWSGISQGKFDPTDHVSKCGACEFWRTCRQLLKTEPAAATDPVVGEEPAEVEPVNEQQPLKDAETHNLRAP